MNLNSASTSVWDSTICRFAGSTVIWLYSMSLLDLDWEIRMKGKILSCFKTFGPTSLEQSEFDENPPLLDNKNLMRTLLS